MRPICGRPLVEHLLRRLTLSSCLDKIVLATSTDPVNDPLESFVTSLGYHVYRGSENDVLDRYYQTACTINASIIVRVTGDCPLIDPTLVDLVIKELINTGADYSENAAIPSYPNGLETEAFTFETLKTTWLSATTPYQREHVTPYIRDSGRFTLINSPAETNHSQHRWTVDEPEDLIVLKNIIEHFDPQFDFGWADIIALHDLHPTWFTANQHIPRNEGSAMSRDEKARRREAKLLT